jgi:hypothetical protein
MRKVSILFACVLQCVALAACGSIEKKIIGSWQGEATVLGINTEGEDATMILTLKENGRGVWQTNYKEHGTGHAITYTLNKAGKQTMLTITLTGTGAQHMFRVDVEGDELTLSLNGTTQTLQRCE